MKIDQAFFYGRDKSFVGEDIILPKLSRRTKTTRETRGMHHAFKAREIATSKDALNNKHLQLIAPQPKIRQ